MKKIALFAVAILLAFTGVYAQKQTGYVIKSKVTVDGITDPNVLAQLPNESTEYMFGNYTKSVMPMGPMNIITINNGDAGTIKQIYDVTGMGKYIVDRTKESAENWKNRDMKFNYTGEKKTIAGYECEKVIVTIVDLENDEEATTTIYVSKDLNPNPAVNFAQFKGLEGYPLRLEVISNANGEDFTMITEAYEVTANKKIKLVEFLEPADGKQVTIKELMKMFGQDVDDDDE